MAIAIPQDTYARVAPRSGLAAKNFIDVGAGVIDFDYRGNVGVVLFNHGPNDFIVHIGDRIAQLILERISMASLEEVTELPASERGTGGFGSTGVSSANRDADVSNEITKRLKTGNTLCQNNFMSLFFTFTSIISTPDNSADAETISRLLVFLDSMSESLGDQRRVALKKLALQSDIRVIAAMEEYNTSQSISALLETVDILLDN